MLILLITYYGNEMWQEGCAYSFDTKLLARMHASSSSPRLPVSTCVTVSTPPSLTHSRRLLLRILSTVGSCEIPLLPIFFFFFQITIEIAFIFEKGGEEDTFQFVEKASEEGSVKPTSWASMIEPGVRGQWEAADRLCTVASLPTIKLRQVCPPWRVVWAVYSARHSPLNEQLNTHLYDAFAVTVNKKGEGGRDRSVVDHPDFERVCELVQVHRFYLRAVDN